MKPTNRPLASTTSPPLRRLSLRESTPLCRLSLRQSCARAASRTYFSRRFFLFALAASTLGCSGDPSRKSLLVSAAADLQEAFAEFGKTFETQSSAPVTFNFAASGMLAQQIKSGAKVDVFAAANVAFVDELETAGLTIPGTKRIYARGRLVAWARADAKVEINSLNDLLKPEIKRIAIANPVTAPYGLAASHALEGAGVREAVQPKLVYGENVRQTLELARSGNVDVALVSRSLVLNLSGKTYLIPEELHSPIEQAAVVIKGAPNEALARRFVETLAGPDGQTLLKRYGFEPPIAPPHK